MVEAAAPSTRLRLARVALVALAMTACGRDAARDQAASPAVRPPAAVAATGGPSTAGTDTAAPTPAAAPTQPLGSAGGPPATSRSAPAIEPRGFPIDPEMRTGLVVRDGGTRRIAWGTGPAAAAYSRDDQPSADPERANRAGWDCRVHVAYEGRPAVDWYVPPGTPVRATMNGTATLVVITVTNAFDRYGVDRAPYLGDPDRSHALLSPFPGPGGGKGVFVRVENGRFTTEYAHLDIGATVRTPPAAAFLPGFGPGTDYATMFAAMRDVQDETPVARRPVRRGDLLGYSGDSGYSEAPHLHYTVSRVGGPLLCPTAEAGFEDGGWLLR